MIGSNGAVMPPYFFASKERLGADNYCDFLRLVVIPWMKAQAAGKNFVFQQDSAPTHTAKKTFNVLKANFIKFWDASTWPSNSLDLSPLNFYF